MFGSRNHGEMTKSEGKIKHQLELLGLLTRKKSALVYLSIYIYLDLFEKSCFDFELGIRTFYGFISVWRRKTQNRSVEGFVKVTAIHWFYCCLLLSTVCLP